MLTNDEIKAHAKRIGELLPNIDTDLKAKMELSEITSEIILNVLTNLNDIARAQRKLAGLL